MTNDEINQASDSTDEFLRTFKQPDAPAKRGAYLSRIFGIISEDIVSTWCGDERSPYENIGRPTVTDAIREYSGSKRGSTLDFTLRNRSTGELFVAEQKCELQYQNYKFITLENASQLDHHNKPAFADFLKCATPTPFNDSAMNVCVDGKPVETHGAILIWGSVAPSGRNAVIDTHGLSDVLAIADIISDLKKWRTPAYIAMVRDCREWSEALHRYLLDE